MWNLDKSYDDSAVVSLLAMPIFSIVTPLATEFLCFSLGTNFGENENIFSDILLGLSDPFVVSIVSILFNNSLFC